MANNYSKCGREKKKYILFDQLNPEYAKYYKKREITQLLEECGFSDIKINPVFNYSWTVIAR
jgi:hypothetical protein